MIFDFITNVQSKILLENVYDSIMKNNLWEWLYSYQSSSYVGSCVFNNHPNFKIIENNIKDVHTYTGCDWNWVMSIMEYIAVYGLESFKKLYIKNKNT